jgi:glycosyltransferase involved in cell wall biosynthesis
MVLAAELPSEVHHLYAHFIHTPGSVTRYAATMLDLPWSVSAHAKDIWTLPKWELSEKLSDCSWAVTCTAANQEYLTTLSSPEKVQLVYHGLDFTRFPDIERSFSGASEKIDTENKTIILSVGRAVVKKGYDILLAALAQLPAETDWSFIHIGGGPLRQKLQAQADSLGISDRIEWRGAQSQDQVIEACRQADIFVLASRVADDGDRDGLPNVLMEAQSLGLPCISTTVSAIPELISHERTGILVPSESSEELAAALENLIQNPDLRERLGLAGKQNVRTNFSLDVGITDLLAKFSNRPNGYTGDLDAGDQR